MPPSRVASRFLVAELVDRAGEALGHLALAVQLQCPLRDVRGTVRDEGATQSDGAGEGGENGGTNAAQFFGPVLPGQVPVVEPLGGLANSAPGDEDDGRQPSNTGDKSERCHCASLLNGTRGMRPTGGQPLVRRRSKGTSLWTKILSSRSGPSVASRSCL